MMGATAGIAKSEKQVLLSRAVYASKQANLDVGKSGGQRLAKRTSRQRAGNPSPNVAVRGNDT